MSEDPKTVTVVLTQEQLKNPLAAIQAIVAAAKAEGKADVQPLIRGTAVVIKKDGTISYKDPSKAGQFHEENLK